MAVLDSGGDYPDPTSEREPPTVKKPRILIRHPKKPGSGSDKKIILYNF